MIVETIKAGGCTCHFDDETYKDKTPEEVQRIIHTYSAFIVECLRKKEVDRGGIREDKHE